MITEMRMTAMEQFLHLLRLAGLALIWLAIPTIGGCPATSADRDHSKAFRLIDNGRLMNAMKSEAGVAYENFIAFQKNGEHFIYASTPPEGSGAFVTEAIFWIAPDRTLHSVVFEQAGRAYENRVNQEEFVLTGGPGILFSEDGLRFEFFIANKGDSSCCPTAGKISGTYKVIGEENFDPKSKNYHCTFKLVADKYKRDIVSSNELSGYLQ
jgi:hypothetical protein